MKKIGLVGGISWSSTLDYYRYINEGINEKLGGLNFSECINPETKRKYLYIIQQLIEQGAEGIVLGCTEIPLLIHQEDVTVSVFDTTRIHSQAAVEFSLST